MAEILTRTDAVFRYADEAYIRPWIPGGGKSGFDGDDCTLFAANWGLKLTGLDPAAGIRGTYATESRAVAIVAMRGGMVTFVGDCLKATGWAPADGLSDGDIAVISAPLSPSGVIGLIPSIRAGGLYIARSEIGIKACMANPVAAWRYPYAR